MIPRTLSSALVLFGVVMGVGLLVGAYWLWCRLGGPGVSSLIMRMGNAFEASAIEFSDDGRDGEQSVLRVADGTFSWARRGVLVASIPCDTVSITVISSPRPGVQITSEDGLDAQFVVDSVFPARWRAHSSAQRRQLRVAKSLAATLQSQANRAQAAAA